MSEPILKQKKIDHLWECELVQQRHAVESGITKNNRVTKETIQNAFKFLNKNFTIQITKSPAKDIFLLTIANEKNPFLKL